MFLNYVQPYIVTILLLLNAGTLKCQFEPNYDEDRVPEYDLPSILTTQDGQIIATSDTWFEKRRPEIIELFENHVYGKFPETTCKVEFIQLSVEEKVISGKAKRKQIKVLCTRDRDTLDFNILIYLPTDASQPVPVFLGLNFYGNHTIHKDSGIILTDSWIRNNEHFHIHQHRATEASRGVRAYRWPVEKILDRGYGLATIYYGDIDPDRNNFSDGIHPLFYDNGQKQPEADEWGAIGAWSWGLIKAMDYLETDKGVNQEKVIVIGHSRLGKTALWTGAADDRFSIVVSNNSGCGGAALSRRKFGETVARINSQFPHWFCDNFNNYNNQEDQLPVDQHMLIALMAPRPVYVASASEDLWADPMGEFLSALHANEAYKLLGIKGLDIEEMPGINQPSIEGHIGYHIRKGKHDITEYDWEMYMDFADIHFHHAMPPTGK